MMVGVDPEALEVYAFIWDTLKAIECLPSILQIQKALHHGHGHVACSIKLLRGAGLIEQASLLPTGYKAWWKEQQQKDQTWRNKPIFRSRKQKRHAPTGLEANAV